MTYKTFKEQVRKAGLGIKEFAALVGMNHKSLSNYSKREAMPEHLALISLMMVELERRDADLRVVFAKMDELGRRARKGQRSGFRGKKGSESLNADSI